jgi:colicin import membrane protein
MNDQRPLREKPRRFLPFFLTVSVHAGLALFLFFGVSWQSQPPGTLEVGLVGAPSLPAPAPQPPSEPPPPEPAPPPEPPKPPEPEPPKPQSVKPEIATKDPKKPEPPKPEPPKPPKPKEPKPLKPLEPIDVSKQLDRAIKQTAEASKVNNILNDGQNAASAGSPGALDDAYQLMIANKVRGNLLKPPGLSGNPEAMFEIDQLPDGSVIAIRLKRSSGDATLDAAIERAIKKSEPLPLPTQGKAPPTLTMRFRPLVK